MATPKSSIYRWFFHHKPTIWFTPMYGDPHFPLKTTGVFHRRSCDICRREEVFCKEFTGARSSPDPWEKETAQSHIKTGVQYIYKNYIYIYTYIYCIYINISTVYIYIQYIYLLCIYIIINMHISTVSVYIYRYRYIYINILYIYIDR